MRLVNLSHLLAVVGLVSSSPVREDLSPTKTSLANARPTCTSPPLSPDPAKWSFEPCIEKHLPNPLPKRAMFWSGNLTATNESILPYAEICADKLGGGTGRMIMCEIGGFMMPDNNVHSAPATKLRDFASEVLANHTNGRSDVMLGDKVRPNGTWRTIELPALKKNPHATVVVEVERNTCQDKCYWYCSEPRYCEVSLLSSLAAPLFSPIPNSISRSVTNR
jgi:hypothetical protein